MEKSIKTGFEGDAISQTTCAGIVFGETSVLMGDATALGDARKFIAAVAYKRNGKGVSKPKIPTQEEQKNPIVKSIWDKCLAAAKEALGSDVQSCRHFVVWPSDDAGKTPSSSPTRMSAEWPYTYSPQSSWGPFDSNIPPKFMSTTYEGQSEELTGKYKNIFVFKYCNVP